MQLLLNTFISFALLATVASASPAGLKARQASCENDGQSVCCCKEPTTVKVVESGTTIIDKKNFQGAKCWPAFAASFDGRPCVEGLQNFCCDPESALEGVCNTEQHVSGFNPAPQC